MRWLPPHLFVRDTRVGRLEQAGIERIRDVGIEGVGVDPGVVEVSLADLPLVVGALPGRASIVGPEDPAFLRLDDRVESVGVRTGYRDPDLAEHAFGHAWVARELGPGIPSVRGLPEPGVRSAAPHLPGFAVHLPDRCVDDVRVLRIEGQVDGSGGIAHVQDPLPALPAVGRAEDAALRVRAERMSERRHVHDALVVRVLPGCERWPACLGARRAPRSARRP